MLLAFRTTIRMCGREEVLDEAAARILAARRREALRGQRTRTALVLLFDSPADPTFRSWRSLSGRSRYDRYDVGDIEFRAGGCNTGELDAGRS